MPGRNDFGVVRSSILTDRRAWDVARAMATSGLSTDCGGVLAVAGAVGLLGLWTCRETDDGVLPGDGVAAASLATGLPIDAARHLVESLVAGKLLRPVPGGLYLVGFRDAYRPLIEYRSKAAARAQNGRAGRREAAGSSDAGSGDRSGPRSPPSSAHQPYRTEPDQTVESPPVEVADAQSADETPPPEEDGFSPSNVGYLSPGLRQELAMAALDLRSRPGRWWEWEKAIQSLVSSGVSSHRVVAALRAPASAPLMPFQLLQMFAPKDALGRVLPPRAPPGPATESGAHARFEETARGLSSLEPERLLAWHAAELERARDDGARSRADALLARARSLATAPEAPGVE